MFTVTYMHKTKRLSEQAGKGVRGNLDRGKDYKHGKLEGK